jgi:hypothetical protein
MMSPQASVEHVSLWQLNSSISTSGQNSSGVYNSGQYFQSQGPQNVPRYANVSQTMMLGNTGESPQIQFIDNRAGLNHMVLHKFAGQSSKSSVSAC